MNESIDTTMIKINVKNYLDARSNFNHLQYKMRNEEEQMANAI